MCGHCAGDEQHCQNHMRGMPGDEKAQDAEMRAGQHRQEQGAEDEVPGPLGTRACQRHVPDESTGDDGEVEAGQQGKTVAAQSWSPAEAVAWCSSHGCPRAGHSVRVLIPITITKRTWKLRRTRTLPSRHPAFAPGTRFHDAEPINQALHGHDSEPAGAAWALSRQEINSPVPPPTSIT
jgi:hypothetical protein